MNGEYAVARRLLATIVSVALLLTGCIVADQAGPFLTFPEGEAISYVVVRDEALDAEVLWSSVHDDIKAETSRAEFFECTLAKADAAPPARALPDELERSLVGLATYGGDVPDDNVLVRDATTYSASDHRTERGIISVDVEVEGPQRTSVTTVLLAAEPEDPSTGGGHDWIGAGPLAVVGTVPEDPCLVGGDASRKRLQTTGTISVGNPDFREAMPERIDYRVLAVLWDEAPEPARLVGGAYWWMDDEGKGGDRIHPPNEGPSDASTEIPVDDEEPRRAPDWIDHAFTSTEFVRLEPGTYMIEIWANPAELTQSADSSLPADAAERNCTIDVEVTAGTHLDVYINDIPIDGSECPHEAELVKGP